MAGKHDVNSLGHDCLVMFGSSYSIAKIFLKLEVVQELQHFLKVYLEKVG